VKNKIITQFPGSELLENEDFRKKLKSLKARPYLRIFCMELRFVSKYSVPLPLALIHFARLSRFSPSPA
jgi:hypothetical protein